MRWAPHPFSLRQLQYLVAIAESGSFRRAADWCAVSQPSLSAQVAQLEHLLGFRVFERSKRRVLVTPAGREVLARAREVLREATDLAEAAARFADPFAGSLRIGVIPTIAPYLLPEIAPVLRASHPNLRLAWTEDKTAVLAAMLRAGDIDGALVALEADLGDVEREVIGRDRFALATPLGHPLGVRTGPATARELAHTPVLLLDDGHCFRDQALAWCEKARASELDFRATSLATLAQMVAGGAGVTLLPELAISTENRRGQLRIRPLGSRGPGRTIGLVWRRATPLAPALRGVAASIKRVYTRLEKVAGNRSYAVARER